MSIDETWLFESTNAITQCNAAQVWWLMIIIKAHSVNQPKHNLGRLSRFRLWVTCWHAIKCRVWVVYSVSMELSARPNARKCNVLQWKIIATFTLSMWNICKEITQPRYSGLAAEMISFGNGNSLGRYSYFPFLCRLGFLIVGDRGDSHFLRRKKTTWVHRWSRIISWKEKLRWVIISIAFIIISPGHAPSCTPSRLSKDPLIQFPRYKKSFLKTTFLSEYGKLSLFRSL